MIPSGPTGAPETAPSKRAGAVVANAASETVKPLTDAPAVAVAGAAAALAATDVQPPAPASTPAEGEAPKPPEPAQALQAQVQAPAQATKEAPAVKKDTDETAKKDADKKDGPGKDYESQLKFAWEQLGKLLKTMWRGYKGKAEERALERVLEEHKDKLSILMRVHGPAAVANSIQEATVGGVKIEDHKNIVKSIENKLLNKDTKKKIADAHNGSVKYFEQSGLTEKQAAAAATFRLSAANDPKFDPSAASDPKNVTNFIKAEDLPTGKTFKFDEKDIAAVFRSAGDGKMPNHTDVQNKIGKYNEAKTEFTKMVGGEDQIYKAEMAAEFSISQSGQKKDGKEKYNKQDVLDGIDAIVKDGSVKNPSNQMIEKAIIETKVKKETEAADKKANEQAQNKTATARQAPAPSNR